MAGRNLQITYVGDANSVIAAQKKIDAGHTQMQGGTKKTGGVFSSVFGNLIPFAAAAAGVAVLGFVKSTITAASDQNESVNKSKVIFGDAAAAVLDFSDTSASSFGISKAAALDAAGGFGAMFDSAGLAQGAAADMSVEMVKLAGDMASFSNADPSDMLIRLRSGLAGEAEPLRKFGVFISAARVQTEAYASGIAEVGEELTEAQKVQARYAVILKDTETAQGDFNRTLGESLPNQLRVAKAELTDLSADLGQHLLPAMLALIKSAREIADLAGPLLEAAFRELGGAASDFADFVAVANEGLDRLIGIIPGVGESADGAAGGFDYLGTTIGIMSLGLIPAGEKLVDWGGKLLGVVTDADEASGATIALANATSTFGGDVTDAARRMEQSLILALRGSTLAAQEHARAVRENADALREQRLAVLALSNSFLGIIDSANQAAEAQRELNRLEQKGKQDTKAYERAVLDAIEAQFGLEESVVSYAQELIDAGRAQGAVEKAVRDVAREMGISKGVVRDLTERVRELSTTFAVTGRNAINAFVRALEAGVDDARAAGFHVASAAAEGLRGGLDISSPSRVTFEMGSQFSAGLAEGIEFGESVIIRTVERVIGKMTIAAEKELAAARDRLSRVRGAAGEFGGAVAGGFGSFTDISGAFAEGTDISAFFAEQLAGAQQWAAVLEALEAQGASRALLQQIAAEGPEALGFAQQLLQSGPEEIQAINDQLRAIEELQDITEDGLTEDFFGDKIDELKDEIRNLVDELRRAERAEGRSGKVEINVNGRRKSDRELAVAIRDELVMLGRRNGVHGLEN